MCFLKKLLFGQKEEGQERSFQDDCPYVSYVVKHPLLKGLLPEFVIVAIIVIPLSYFLVENDFFESWYQYTRIHEDWELDEWFSVFISILIAFFILAQRRLFVLIKMHEELKETTKRLLEKEREECKQKRLVAMGSLSSGLAHEINNALQPVLGLGEFVRAGLQESKNEKHLAYMNTILNGAYHARGILENVLLYSKEKTLTIEEHWARALLLHTFNFCASVIPPGTECVWKGLESLDGADERLIMHCNKTSLSQILFNLMKNASESMDGGGEISVLVRRCEMKNGQGKDIPAICIDISDTGCGMDEETKQRIFEPFFTTKEASQGTGLGLAGVYSLMQQHNGEVAVESAPGEGTTVSLFFPVIVESKTGVHSPKGEKKSGNTKITARIKPGEGRE